LEGVVARLIIFVLSNVEKYPQRELPDIPIACRLSGFEPCTIEEGSC
jgi:hypothetical protein